MKNNKIIFIIIFLFFFSIPSPGEEFNFKSSKINVFEKGNLIIAENGVEIVTKDNLIIEGEKSEYNILNHENTFKKWCHNVTFETIDGVGHWVQAEAPTQFYNLIVPFLSTKINRRSL